ncbi:hypothetical protein ACWEV4_02330 [Streptomyces sp. NPDC003860]
MTYWPRICGVRLEPPDSILNVLHAALPGEDRARARTHLRCLREWGTHGQDHTDIAWELLRPEQGHPWITWTTDEADICWSVQTRLDCPEPSPAGGDCHLYAGHIDAHTWQSYGPLSDHKPAADRAALQALTARRGPRITPIHALSRGNA